MNRNLAIWAGVLIMTAIILGALGAHGLKDVLNEVQMNSYLTGVRYQMYSGISLLILSGMYNSFGINLKWVGRLLIVGTLLFSFSIYPLALQDAMGVKLSFLGPITPIGGLILVAAWSVFIVQLFLKKN